MSVHDVMPATLADVRTLVGRLERLGLAPATLLIVPGCSWHKPELAQLHRWQHDGHELAGHGWIHRAVPPRGLYHHLHAALLSRSSGEHLSLTPEQILDLMRRNYRWFVRQGLAAPELYVPPAWALGAIGRARLAEQPFAHVETLGGVYEIEHGRMQRLPLVGFEADTAVRRAALRLWNGRPRRRGPVRVALHPADYRLRLRRELARTLATIRATQTYAAWRRAAVNPRPRPT